MSTPDDTDTGSTFSPVGSLRSDGTLEGSAGSQARSSVPAADEAPLELARPPRHPARPTPPPGDFGAPRGEALPPGFQADEALELVPHVRHTDRAQPPSAFLTPPAPERSRGVPRGLVRLLLMLVVAAAAYSIWQWFDRGGTVGVLQEQARSLQQEARTLKRSVGHAAGFTQGTVLFLSHPDGATVTIDGEVIGVTPFAGDLRWAGDAEITFSRRGYAPWTGTLPAGPEVKLNVTLKRATAR